MLFLWMQYQSAVDAVDIYYATLWVLTENETSFGIKALHLKKSIERNGSKIAILIQSSATISIRFYLGGLTSLQDAFLLEESCKQLNGTLEVSSSKYILNAIAFRFY